MLLPCGECGAPSKLSRQRMDEVWDQNPALVRIAQIMVRLQCLGKVCENLLKFAFIHGSRP
jgi:hypothetical protein